MKKLILLLSIVCTVFILFGGITAFAYDSQSEAESDVGKLRAYISERCKDTDEIVIWYSGGNLNGCAYNCETIYSSGNISLFNCRTCYKTSDCVNIIASITGSNANKFAVDSILYSSTDLYDSEGKVVFSPPPVQVAPGLEGITVDLLLGVLRELKPILLGLAVSVIGFLAFRKAWSWVLVNLRQG